MKRYRDWLKQADEDLKAAQDSKKTNHFEWACFQAQQSAEKSLKSVLLFLNTDSWGHGLVHLLEEISTKIEIVETTKTSIKPENYKLLKEHCQELDRHYIQPRYPNGFADGYPSEYYNEKIAKRCISYSNTIHKWVKEKIKQLSSSE